MVRFGQWLREAGVSRAVAFSITTQVWMALAGPMTTIVIASHLDSVSQGFFYTFSSVLGMQVLFELGLATVIVQGASHEWVHLHRAADGRIGGDGAALARLASLARFSVGWYSVAAVLFVLVFLLGGSHYFGAKASGYALAWWPTWIFLISAIGLYLLVQPLFSLVEGCNQVDSLYGIRLLQAIAASLGTIIALILGAGLLSLAIGAWLRLILGAAWLGLKQWGFCRLLLQRQADPGINWKHEIWPFQWRIALSWLSGYVVFSLITPVMFHFHGPVVAGQVGMSLALAGLIDSVASAWLVTRSPKFGMLIAQRDFHGLDWLFARSLRTSMAVAVAGALAVLLGAVLLQVLLPQYAARLLPLLPLGLLVVNRTANVAVTGMALYLRAHKREPFMGVSIVNACLVGFVLMWLGATHGVTEALLGSLVVTAFWTLPAGYRVFRRCRAEWHR